uniref:Uncharacterized protein n=1 Tax=Mus musculus TaxID=10090 RepID=Q3V438_MOUSE|nr:unnamed protein product [Mus musculus]
MYELHIVVGFTKAFTYQYITSYGRLSTHVHHIHRFFTGMHAIYTDYICTHIPSPFSPLTLLQVSFIHLGSFVSILMVCTHE